MTRSLDRAAMFREGLIWKGEYASELRGGGGGGGNDDK